MNRVANKFPVSSAGYKLAIIGEAPGRDEEAIGQPFVGVSGRFLADLLSRAGLNRDLCLVGNITQYRPPNNEIYHFQWDGYEIQEGMMQLRLDLLKFQPNLCLLLGNVALKAAMDPGWAHPLSPGKYRYSVDNYRGTLFESKDMRSPFFGFKCMSTYHPAYVLRDYAASPLLQFDLKRAAAESRDRELRIPNRIIETCLSADEYIARLDQLGPNAQAALDIEGGVEGVTCISFCTDPLYAYVIPFLGQQEGSYFPTIEEEARVWKALHGVLACPTIPKTLQNCLYEGFVFGWNNHTIIRGVKDDTMLKAWELYCELPKDLGTLASLFTKEPYYKVSHSAKARAERRTNPNAWREYLIYNGKDSVVTYEINQTISPYLDARAQNHYRFNLDLLSPILYMELRGIRYNVSGARERASSVCNDVYRLQAELDKATGYGLAGRTRDELSSRCRELMCYKRDPTVPKKDYITSLPRALSLIQRVGELSPAETGELSTLLDLSLNIKSDNFKDYLYNKLRLPLQTHRETGQPTTNEDALLKLCKKTNSPVPGLAISIANNRTRAQMLSIHADGDGRIRCGYNVVGTETSRITSYTSPTGSGYNLQTIPKKDRDLFIADEGCWMFECDLKGSDGWTIGAHCKALGDPTMIDDLSAGLKPAAVLTLMLRHGTQVGSLPREELKEMSKGVKGEDWDYFALKIGIWGMCYLMGPDLLSDVILKESEGKVALDRKSVAHFRNITFTRYKGVPRWHEFMGRRLRERPQLISASGHKRVFFGRASEILGEALADEPQQNTTYATKRALYNLWADPENRVAREEETRGLLAAMPYRRPGVYLRVEPLHTVHDSLVGQFRKEDTTWAVSKIQSWFANPLIIAGQKIIIPYEGHYGVSWGNLKEGTI